MKRIAYACFLLLFLLAAACQPQPQSIVVPVNSLTAATPTPATPALPTTVPDTPTKLMAEVVKSDALLRNGPGEAGVVINKLGTGTLLTVRHPERGGPWYEVTYEAAGQSGWIHGSLIRFKTGDVTLYKPKSSSTPSPTPSPTLADTSLPDLSDLAENEEGADSADSVKVWVNTNSGVYHCPGTRWYGDTKEGEYMTQAQAVADGNRPAYGRKCY